jgi:hypothetical protein
MGESYDRCDGQVLEETTVPLVNKSQPRCARVHLRTRRRMASHNPTTTAQVGPHFFGAGMCLPELKVAHLI